jgi:undecaprenyl pyrophosphate phosphatase UppP
MLLFLWAILQICLESLPVSSSGHTLLLLNYFDKHHEIISIDDLYNFDWALHGITLLVILFYFWNSWWRLILHRSFSLPLVFTLDFWKKFLHAFAFVSIVSLVFLCLYVGIAMILLFSFNQPPRIPLFLGFCITALELWYSNKKLQNNITFIPVQWNFSHAILLGIINAIVAYIPGVSRFGTNFLLLLMLRYKPSNAFAISWMTCFPFALGGSIYGIMYIMRNPVLLEQILHINLLLVMVGAGLISYILLHGFRYLMDQKKLHYLVWFMLISIVLSIMLMISTDR